GRPLGGPNDLTLDPTTGGVFFTDPAKSDEKNPDGTIHYLDRRWICHTVAKARAFPNGIVIRPGGKELLVAESKRNRILAFPVLGAGGVGGSPGLLDLPGQGAAQEVDTRE